MTTPDILVLAVLTLGGLFGAMRGAIKQVTLLVGWVASIAASYFFAAPVAHLVAVRFDTPYPVALVVSGIALGIVAQLLTRFLFFLVGKIVRKIYDAVVTAGESKEEKEHEALQGIQGSAGDRLLGALFGAAKWGLVGWVALSGFALVAKPLRDHGYKISVEDSEAYKLCEQHNAFAMLWADNIASLSQALLKLSKTRMRVAGSLAQDPSYVALEKDARVQQVLNDQPLQKALSEGDFQHIATSPNVLSLLTDPEAMRTVVEVAMDRHTQPILDVDKEP